MPSVADLTTLRKYEEKRGTFAMPFDDMCVIYGFQMMTYLDCSFVGSTGQTLSVLQHDLTFRRRIPREPFEA